MENKRAGDPGVAAVLSFFFNGLGQIYNGQITKGLTIMSFSLGGMIIVFAGMSLTGYWLLGRVVMPGQIFWGLSLVFSGLLVIGAFGIYSIFDAYNTALKK
jgi:TM2 domain-containing membrane protein YozV